MKRRLTLAFVLCVLATGGQAEKAASVGTISPPPVDEQKRCEALAGTRLGDATIDEAQWLKRGDPLLGFVQRMMILVSTKGAISFDAPVNFCRVTAKLRPVPGSQIKVGVWLPQPWNGKLLGGGGGGFNGGISVGGFIFMNPLAKGYAGVATDAGHDDTDSAKFAYDSAEALKDYGYRANHLGADFAKRLVSNYYGSPAKRTYFNGCSNGGRDALILAQRYPEDYDAIISGAPAADFTNLMSRFVWNRNVVEASPKLGSKLKMIQAAVIAKCDARDGMKDGLLENPLSCPFDPAELQCKGDDGPSCLNTAEVGVMRKIYQGPRLSDGTQLYPGQPVGAEALPGGWDDWVISDKQPSIGPEFFRWMVYRNPQWKVEAFEPAREFKAAKERLGPVVDATNPDIGPFLRRGGKLLMYHGWNDVAVPAGATLDYHAAMRKAVGPLADQQTRLFMVPGLLHCGGGPGATHFDKLDELDRWVESGKAPDQIVATEFNPPATIFPLPNAKKVRTRPLCPWPKTALYNGSGPTTAAENFSCK